MENNFKNSLMIGIVIYLIAFILKYFVGDYSFSKILFIILLVLGGIFFIPLISFLIFFIYGFFEALLSKNKKKRRK